MLGKVGPASAGSSPGTTGGRRHTLLPWRLLKRELIIGLASALSRVAVPDRVRGGFNTRTLSLIPLTRYGPMRERAQRANNGGSAASVSLSGWLAGSWVFHANGMPGAPCRDGRSAYSSRRTRRTTARSLRESTPPRFFIASTFSPCRRNSSRLSQLSASSCVETKPNSRKLALQHNLLVPAQAQGGLKTRPVWANWQRCSGHLSERPCFPHRQAPLRAASASWASR